MALDDGVRIIDGVIHIDHAAIEAGLGALAARWQVTVEEALGIVLRNALAEQVLEDAGPADGDGIRTLPAYSSFRRTPESMDACG
ncbi:hypothetical protein [uncultured Sphingomonas sp.]|uniref:hypothetical protein n=1 Tax=uncultured Sphingomonas sp. TaxID=158754 RepID=UPI0025F80F6B|nr:hypothetical protein [uncultured Sphingomonas sp.]